jgi:hypothetical protein
VPARPASTTRRGALGGVLALAVLAACDVDDLRPPEDEAVPTPTPSSSATPEPDADAVLAADTASDIASTLVLVDGVRRSFPRLRRDLQPLAKMHRAHLAVLEPPDDRSVPAPDLGGTPAEAMNRVRGAEQTLQHTLADAAVRAESGALARLLASISASVSQHLSALGGPA